MTDSEISKIVSKVLRARLRDLGFQRLIVQSEQDFDNSTILRMTVFLKESNVPPARLTDALHEIRSELLNNGEDRFVLLSSRSPNEELIDEDVD